MDLVQNRLQWQAYRLSVYGFRGQLPSVWNLKVTTHVSFEILTAEAVKSIAFWYVTSCSLVGAYLLFNSEDGDGTFPPKVGEILPESKALDPRRQYT
jgi:hypothetical protein